jgi:hypothetical protein
MIIVYKSNLRCTHVTNPRQYSASASQVQWTIGRVHANSIDGLQHDYDTDWCTSITECQQFYYNVV